MSENVEKANLRYSVSLVTQGKHRFYTLTMFSDVLARTCFVTTRFSDPKEGFQRLLDENRAQQIADYIDKGFGSIPNSIVVSAQQEAELKVVGKGKTLQFRDTPKAFLILDGQHRVFGFSKAETKLRVPVVIYNNLSRQDETRLFIDINTKQRPVPNELLLDIKSLAAYENDTEKLLREIFDCFSSDPGSPLLGLLSPAEKALGKISRVTFNAALKPLVGSFTAHTGQEIFLILSSYLQAFKTALAGSDEEVIITNPIAFRAIMLLFKDAAQRVKDKHGKAYTAENFSEALSPLVSQMTASQLKKTNKGSKALYEELVKKIRSEFSL